MQQKRTATTLAVTLIAQGGDSYLSCRVVPIEPHLQLLLGLGAISTELVRL